jgi:hypothetical protein
LGARSQLNALEDGRLTFDEMEAALTAFVQCLIESGVEFRQPPFIDDDGVLHYDASAGSTESELFDTEAKLESCDYRHTSILKRFWAWSRAPTEQERVETRRHLANCLREHGLDASEVPSDEELGRLLTASPQVFDTCARRATHETGASGF